MNLAIAPRLPVRRPTMLEEAPVIPPAPLLRPVDSFELSAPQQVEEVPRLTDPKDFSVPRLDQVFDVASHFPGKMIQLDTKLPPNEPGVARRMANQYMDALRRHPELKDQVFIACNDKQMLTAMKKEFAKNDDFKDFRNFSFDHEELNDFILGGNVNDADPLKGSGNNKFVSIGDPRAPLRVGGFDDLLALSKKTLKKTRDPSSKDFGKQLVVWTINDEDKMRKVVALKPDYIVTDNPALLKKVIDEVCGPNDPLRPKIQCHRGGPDGLGLPENTLPMIEQGFRTGDSVEFDVCAAKDGPVVFHDNDPNSVVSVMRNLGIAGDGQFRPTVPSLGDPLRGLRLDQLTVDQIRKAYGYARR
ncbi:MAG: glycerophosphoryl diester phosphodiesterase [Myxococcaceae bacterium]|nr:glycerophosphoryl diester phosphodiesterase [Myxococcaceae bacterium]